MTVRYPNIKSRGRVQIRTVPLHGFSLDFFDGGLLERRNYNEISSPLRDRCLPVIEYYYV
jgi:hypothetical protein